MGWAFTSMFMNTANDEWSNSMDRSRSSHIALQIMLDMNLRI